MYNTTYTTFHINYNSSKLQEYEEVDRDIDIAKKAESYSNVFDYGYLYSIILKRETIMEGLDEYFDIESSDIEELDFLAENLDLLELLPGISLYIHHSLDSNAKLSLELLTEGSDWQTMFINIITGCDWETSNSFVDELYEFLFKEFPDIANKLNVNIVPNEF